MDAERATREIDDIQSGRRITQFVQERAASAEYRGYLGVIALIRRDFDELSKLLLESTTKNKPPFDRIILYIDDLNRCRAELVVKCSKQCTCCSRSNSSSWWLTSTRGG